MPEYTGTSIVDYLKSVGQPSDFSYRSQLATQKGIQNYAGTAEQNTQLLNLLRSPVSAPSTTSTPQPSALPPQTSSLPTAQTPTTSLDQGFTSFVSNAANQTIQRAQQMGQPQSVTVDSNSAPLYQGLGFTIQQQGNQTVATYTPLSPTANVPQNQGISGPRVGEGSGRKFVDIQGAVFEQTPQGLAAISDPNILRQIQSGQIQVQRQQSTEGQQFAQAISTPTGIQQTQPQAQLGPQQPLQPVETGTQPGPVATTFSDLLKRYGVNLDPSAFQISPATSVSSIVDTLSKKAGLDTVKSNIDQISGRIKAIDVELGDKIADVNENPWISESLRQKKIAALNEKYEARRNAEVNQLRLQESVFNQAREDVRFVTQQAVAEAARIQGLELRQLEQLINLAEEQFQAQQKIKEFDTSRYKEVQGGLYDLKERRFIVQPKPTATAGTGLLSPTEAAALGVPFGTTEAQAFGITPVTGKLSAGEREDIATGDVLTKLADEALSIGQKTGFAGTGSFFRGTLSQFIAQAGLGKEQEQELRNIIGNITGTLAKLRGGTSFTQNEQKLLETYTPTINDSALVLSQKLQSLKRFLADKREATLGALSASPSDLKKENDPLGIR